jgi:hypothetical protein
MVLVKKISFVQHTPFLISPRGEMIRPLITPYPVGEGWEGGYLNKK